MINQKIQMILSESTGESSKKTNQFDKLKKCSKH